MQALWHFRPILTLVIALAIASILPLAGPYPALAGPSPTAGPAANPPLASHGAPAANEEVRGELDNWQNPPAWLMSSSLGGSFIYTSGQVGDASDPASEFKFYKDSNQWFSNGSAVTFGQVFAGMSTATGPNMSFNHVQDHFYAFKWNGNDRGVIFQLSGSPANITGVSQSPTNPGSADAVTVTATTDVAPPTEQALWLRYALNNDWANSPVVKMSGSGTSYAAVVPAQPDGTVVSYYVFSSGDIGSIAPGDADLMTITFDTNGGSNYAYTVGGTTISDARAIWLDGATIAWNGLTGASYKLLYDPDGGLDAVIAGASACAFPSPDAPCHVSLAQSGTVSGYPQNPNATGLTRLLTGLSGADAKALLRGQLAVASHTGGGALLDVSGVQIQSLLDDLYVANGTAASQVLGVSYSGDVPTVKLWAPTAQAVTLRRYANATTALFVSHPMALDSASGVWSVTGDAGWDGQFYLFDVQVYMPVTGAVENNLVGDPYAINLSTDSTDALDPRSQFVDLDDASLKPAGWDALAKPALAAPEDIVLYEMHVRDFSINDASVQAAHQGTFKAFAYDGQPGSAARADAQAGPSDGMAHLLALQEAGLTHVHLLPAFDIASVIEDSAERTEPAIAFNPATDRASSGPQAEVADHRAEDGFNWGYDPYHYGAPEGSYATNPGDATRILEFREMVQRLNENGLRVVMDVVYNHTAASGQDDKSVLDKIVPGYYYRYDLNGDLYNSSCCSDTASEYAMMEKLMIDTVLRWARDYKVDGFRFDLMNLHTRQNMLNVQAALQGLTLVGNGVDGSEIYLYGEGWDFGSAVAKGLTTCPNCYAKQANMAGSGIGTFNDRLRDAAHGGYSTDPLQIRHQGFINGLSFDWNGYCYSNRFQSDLHNAMNTLRSALRGSGDDYTDDPQESVPYVSKHDNETLFDQNVFKAPRGNVPASDNGCGFDSSAATISMADRVRLQNMGLSLVGLAQGVPFFHMGSDILRSKSLDRNSYDSGDWFNTVDWTYAGNNFGRGLPPAWDNSARWAIMIPLLEDTSMDPATSDIDAGAGHLREVLRIRQSSPLFRLGSEADVDARVSFYNADNSQDALLVMALSDGPAPDLDPNYEAILVFFNAHKIAQDHTIPGANGFVLHPVQADAVDVDPVVQTAIFDDVTDTFTIPARTMAVFVSTQIVETPSSVDYVGQMYPRGGVANRVDEGAFAPSGFDVYVQVYEAGVTEGSGQGAGIACYLYWGRYGEPFQDLAMSFNADIGNNDEYKAILSQTTLNGLAPGTYGFTAYCQKDGETGKKWKQDGYDLGGNPADDDQGDGLITVVPTGDPRPAPAGGAFVHLFEWRWADVEKECTYLAEKGYAAVQVSPPQEHLVPTADQGGQADSDYPWWVRYQPVSHDTSLLTSRSGTLAEFQSMVNTCGNLGVDIYVDAVFNHMADIEVGTPPQGTAGTEYESSTPGRFYGTQYQEDDFHADCNIASYQDRYQVQRCQLSGLPDLDTGKMDVQGEIRDYLQALIGLGVKGFRVDGAKHMAAHEIDAILAGLTGDFYVFQEVIDLDPSERVRDWEYAPQGDVTEFAWSQAMADKFNQCNGSISDLQVLPYGNMMESRFAVVFTDNHDNQRGHGPGGSCIVDHRDGAVYDLANIFTLAHPYGYPKVMSSYYWNSNPGNDDGDSLGPPSTTPPYAAGSGPDTRPVYGVTQVAGDVPENCANTYQDGQWVCEHRRTAIANMVQFRWATEGEPLTDWQAFGPDDIAFGRGDKGFVAINRSNAPVNHTYQTSLPAGTYCDVIKYDFRDGRCLVPGSTTPAPTEGLITVQAGGDIAGHTVAAMDAFAIHLRARIFSAQLDPIPGGVRSTWDLHPAAARYRVLRAANSPYFWPDPDPVASGQQIYSGTDASYDDLASAVNSWAVNHFYLAQALDHDDVVIGTSGWSGEFTFNLVPGGP